MIKKIIPLLVITLYIAGIVYAANVNLATRTTEYREAPVKNIPWELARDVIYRTNYGDGTGCDNLIMGPWDISKLDGVPDFIYTKMSIKSVGATNDDIIGTLLCEVGITPEKYADTIFSPYRNMSVSEFDSHWIRIASFSGSGVIAATNDSLITGQANMNSGYPFGWKLPIGADKFRFIYKPTVGNADSIGYLRLRWNLVY